VHFPLPCLESGRRLQPTGSNLAAPQIYGGSNAIFSRQFKNGIAKQVNFFVEKSFGANGQWLASAGYSGSFSDNLMNRNYPFQNMQSISGSTLSTWLNQYVASNGSTNPANVQVQNPWQPATGALLPFTGTLAGYFGGWVDTFLMRLTDLFLSVPWLFLILTVRAVLPLNVSPFESVGITFLLLGMLGWASAARVVRSTALSLEARDFMIQARARGCGHWRLLAVHLLPNLRPVVAAQFWMSIPIFILSEANLGFLGLGVAEPLPSWGSLLSGLQSLDTLAAGPWRLAPLGLLVLVMTCFHLVVPMDDFSK